MPMLLYNYSINKKLNLIRDLPLHAIKSQYECSRGGQISLQQVNGGMEKSDRNDEVASTNINQRSKNNVRHIRRLYEGSDIRVCEDCGRKGDR